MTASALLCLVIAISDGDTLTCLTDDKQQHKIRLAEIDAPEKRQPFGTRSRQSLGELCHEKRAEVRVTDRDRYGRTVGRVTCAGVDANAEQVRRGMAWVYDRYATDKSLYRLQDEAKAEKRGLWADQSPTPPWNWRRQRHTAAIQPAQAIALASAGEVRANTKSGIYHLSGCRNFHDVNPRNIVVFKTENEAQVAGYRKAINCFR